MSKLKNHLKHIRLTFLFASIVFTILFFTMSLLFLGTHLLNRLGVIGLKQFERFPLFVFCFISILLGTVLAAFFSKKPLKPLREIMEATDKIADGDYSVRIHLNGPEEFRQLSDKFNHMAAELSSVEMLRNDFVNNFSHEFKTPIVSIRGFAKALKWENLSSEERAEYLDIIISESERLTELASNVLYLSKLENQSILTNKERFNVSEQLRIVIALLDQKITEKNLEILFDSSEYFADGNKEMMKQVWINLLHNAIKFSPSGGTIKISINEINNKLSVKICNPGKEIPPETIEHIFDKFYQGDLSHSQSGNGLGLAIVKKILDLHNSDIYVRSSNSGNTFEIILNSK